jgi:hypothetical protein
MELLQLCKVRLVLHAYKEPIAYHYGVSLTKNTSIMYQTERNYCCWGRRNCTGAWTPHLHVHDRDLRYEIPHGNFQGAPFVPILCHDSINIYTYSSAVSAKILETVPLNATWLWTSYNYRSHYNHHYGLQVWGWALSLFRRAVELDLSHLKTKKKERLTDNKGKTIPVTGLRGE